MPRHSKNANSKGFFTYDQTKKYKYISPTIFLEVTMEQSNKE